MSADKIDKINPSVADKAATTQNSSGSRKSVMNSTAKEFVPKQKILSQKSKENTDDSDNFCGKANLVNDKTVNVDYNVAELSFDEQFSSESALNESENCLSVDIFTTCPQNAPVRPTSLNMTVSNLTDSTSIYPTLTLPNQPIYPLDPNTNSFYGCIANNQDPMNSVTYMATTSPQFHNSGGSSPHSYQSVSPPIINSSSFAVPNANSSTNPSIGGEHYVMVHVNLGETFSIRVGDQIQNISGPATVRMVSNSGPPTPMPMQVPPGHMVQQIVDENGILTHVILSPLHQPTQCLTSHMQPIHTTNSPSYYTSQANPSIPVYANNFSLYSNGSNVSQTINNVNNSQLPNSHSSVTSNNFTSDSGKSCHLTQSIAENKSRPVKPRVQHQYHHSSQSEDPSYFPKQKSCHLISQTVSSLTNSNEAVKTQPSESYYHHDKAVNNGGSNNHSREDSYYENFPSYTAHNHYSKYRKKRPFPNSASATKHHYIHDQSGSPISSADEVGTILTDEEKRAIRDVLNAIDKPEVSEIEARSALIHIICPKAPNNCVATINSSDFTFQLHFAERNPESRYNCVFYGEAVEISLQDLKPATDYYVKVCCIYENITGNLSPANKFTTLPAEPNPPKPVILQSKSRNYIQVKWNSPVENGSKITEFLLEYRPADLNNDNYIQAFRGNVKTFKILKLKASTEYFIRLSAINAYGQSLWSDPLSVTTSGTAPPAPEPPTLARADTSGLLLTWKKRPSDETFCLEMMDEATGYGFITVFNGPEVEHYVENLRRNTNYRFHLAASNQDGRSKWSDVVIHSTKPDLPSSPLKLHVRGKISPTSFCLVWEPPEDDGGLPIIAYKVEMDINADISKTFTSNNIMDDSDRDWISYFESNEKEYNCKSLTPGSTVLVRVSAKSSVGGWGVPCLPITINLASMPPGQMLPPRKDIGFKAKGGNFIPGGINLVWEKPETDGGSAISSYELCQWFLKTKSRAKLTDSNDTVVSIEEYIEETEEQVVYNGPQLHCQITGLIPGAVYRYRIRAINKAGNGKWSNHMDASSGPSAPEAPSEAPIVSWKSPLIATISWMAPTNANGSSIIEYRLESKVKSDPGVDFQLVYTGPYCSFDLKSLLPDTCYRFRVQAVNKAGVSPYSPICDIITPPSVPGQVSSLRAGSLTMHSIHIYWKEPPNNGSSIINYVVEVTCCNSNQFAFAGSNINNQNTDTLMLSTEATDKIISDLLPDTSYKFKIQAVNSVGSGPFSQSIKISTLHPPPAPPRLECLNVQSNSIKLRWNNDQPARQYYITRLTGSACSLDKPFVTGNTTEPLVTQYQLQMSRQSDSGWSNVYTGSLQFHKLGKLLESTSYYFRIMASNEVGDGDFSEPFLIVTEKAAPHAVRAPKISEITTDSCLIEWPVLRSMNNDPIVYILQLLMISEKDSDYKQVYRGSDTSFRLKNLSAGTEYLTRVCAVRLCSPSTISNNEDFDSSLHFQKSIIDLNKSEKSNKPKNNSSPVTELLGPFSKSVSFTTHDSNYQVVSNIANNSGNTPLIRNYNTINRWFQVPTFVKRWLDNIGPWTDNHFVFLLLVIFLVLVLILANILQNYLK